MQRFQSTVLISLLVIAAVFGAIVVLHPNTIVKLVTGISGWVLLIFQWSYNHWERVYLLVQRFRMTFSPDTTWNMSVRYKLKGGQAIIDSIQEDMLRVPRVSEQKITRTLPSCLDVVIDGAHFQVLQTAPDCLEVHVLAMSVTVNKTEHVLTRRISPILEVIEGICHPVSKRYYLTVRFDGKTNPYFGLYLKRLAEKNVVHFDVTFNVEDGNIELHRDSLTIKTESFTDMFNLSRQYIVLSS